MSSPATSTPLTPSQSGRYRTDLHIFNWQNQSFREDLILILPIAICLGIGLGLGHPAAGMIAGGGAMTVGFGRKQSIDESPLLPMLFWSKMYGKRRVFYSTLGHTEEAWSDPDIRKMYFEAVKWVLGMTDGSTASHPRPASDAGTMQQH